jgi:hypothetical protein
MKKTLVLALALAAAASPALSQTQGSSRADDQEGYSSGRGGGGGSWREDRGWRERDGDRGRRVSDDERSSRRPTGGASFMVRSGDARVAVRCDAGESMRACVDATLILLERVRSGSTAGTSGTSSNVGSGSATPTPPR